MPNVERLGVPVKLRLELGAVVGLHDLNPKREAPHDLVEEADGCSLVAGIEHLQDTDSRAIIDGCELIQPFPGAGDSLEEFHVHLEAMSGLWLFVALPALLVWPVLLIRRQPIHPMLAEDAMDGRPRHQHLVKSL